MRLPWLIHVNVWQKPLQYCKVISLQLIKINEEKMRLKWPFQKARASISYSHMRITFRSKCPGQRSRDVLACPRAPLRLNARAPGSCPSSATPPTRLSPHSPDPATRLGRTPFSLPPASSLLTAALDLLWLLTQFTCHCAVSTSEQQSVILCPGLPHQGGSVDNSFVPDLLSPVQRWTHTQALDLLQLEQYYQSTGGKLVSNGQNGSFLLPTNLRFHCVSFQ